MSSTNGVGKTELYDVEEWNYIHTAHQKYKFKLDQTFKLKTWDYLVPGRKFNGNTSKHR